MKSGESFQLTEAWWKAGKPALLTDTGLGAALRTFHEKDGVFQAEKTYKSYLNAVKALDLVDQARLTAIQKCGSNPLFKDAKAALQKDSAIAQRRTVFKQVVTKTIEAEVHEIEVRLEKESLYVKEADRTSDALSKRTAQAILEGNVNAKHMVSQLESYNRGSAIRNDMVAYHIETEYLRTLPLMMEDFPAHANRLKVVRSASMKNGTELMRIATLAGQAAKNLRTRL